MAAACAPAKRFKALLKINSLSYTMQDDRGRDLVHYAAANEDKGVMEFLVELGADTTLLDKRGMSPLHLACKHGRGETAVLLLGAVCGA